MVIQLLNTIGLINSKSGSFQLSVSATVIVTSTCPVTDSSHSLWGVLSLSPGADDKTAPPKG